MYVYNALCRQVYRYFRWVVILDRYSLRMLIKNNYLLDRDKITYINANNSKNSKLEIEHAVRHLLREEILSSMVCVLEITLCSLLTELTLPEYTKRT